MLTAVVSPLTTLVPPASVYNPTRAISCPCQASKLRQAKFGLTAASLHRWSPTESDSGAVSAGFKAAAAGLPPTHPFQHLLPHDSALQPVRVLKLDRLATIAPLTEVPTSMGASHYFF